jgi:hypothetical protein
MAAELRRLRYTRLGRIDAKGRIRKCYRYQDMMTTYDKLKSLPDSQQYLKPGVTCGQLDAIAYIISDNEATQHLNKPKTRPPETVQCPSLLRLIYGLERAVYAAYSRRSLRPGSRRACHPVPGNIFCESIRSRNCPPTILLTILATDAAMIEGQQGRAADQPWSKPCVERKR